MSENTPLYCPCGNRLGSIDDGAFVSQHKGRAVAVGKIVVDGKPAVGMSVRCENCRAWTEVDKLLRVG